MTQPDADRGSRHYYIETWGCQMNQLDSQRMAGQLMQQGLLPTRDPRRADVILLNSCSVREKAEQKVYSRIGQYRLLKRDRPDLMIGLCGCVAEQAAERALRRVPDLDFVLGTGRIADLVDVMARRRAGERLAATGFDEARYEFDSIAREGEYKGMVTIIEGCNKNCTFCIVPTTRGPERCRPIAQILREVEHLVDYGFHEIELLGQTVNHWREPGGGLDFADLLDAVARIDGVDRLRFVTSYPRDFTPRMAEQFARHPNICPYLHIPVQSGSDRMLRLMGRGHEISIYYELIRQLRAARPEIAISTDLIVGFPGEREEDFEETLELVRSTRFASIYAFKFSERPGDGGTAPTRSGRARGGGRTAATPVRDPAADPARAQSIARRTRVRRSRHRLEQPARRDDRTDDLSPRHPLSVRRDGSREPRDDHASRRRKGVPAQSGRPAAHRGRGLTTSTRSAHDGLLDRSARAAENGVWTERSQTATTSTKSRALPTSRSAWRSSV